MPGLELNVLEVSIFFHRIETKQGEISFRSAGLAIHPEFGGNIFLAAIPFLHRDYFSSAGID